MTESTPPPTNEWPELATLREAVEPHQGEGAAIFPAHHLSAT